jgi:hypothetical protein
MTRKIAAAVATANPIVRYTALALVAVAWVAGAVALDVPATVGDYAAAIPARLLAYFA